MGYMGYMEYMGYMGYMINMDIWNIYIYIASGYD